MNREYLKIEITYFGGGTEYKLTTENVNRAYQATGFIPQPGDQIWLEEEDKEPETGDENVVTVVMRWIHANEDGCVVELHVSNQGAGMPALVDEDNPTQLYQP